MKTACMCFKLISAVFGPFSIGFSTIDICENQDYDSYYYYMENRYLYGSVRKLCGRNKSFIWQKKLVAWQKRDVYGKKMSFAGHSLYTWVSIFLPSNVIQHCCLIMNLKLGRCVHYPAIEAKITSFIHCHRQGP